MKYEVMVESMVDWLVVDADNEEQAKEKAIEIARNGAEWTASITNEFGDD